MSLKSWTAEQKSFAGTVALTAVFFTLGIVAFRKAWPNNSTGWIIWLGLAAGGVGGLIHEFAQSGGRLLLTKREADGIYLGGLIGLLLGALAGVLAVQSLFAQPAMPSNAAQQTNASVACQPTPGTQSNTAQSTTPCVSSPSTTGTPPTPNTTPTVPQSPLAIQALYTALLAGLSLKGIAEAATGQAVSSANSPAPPQITKPN